MHQKPTMTFLILVIGIMNCEDKSIKNYLNLIIQHKACVVIYHC